MPVQSHWGSGLFSGPAFLAFTPESRARLLRLSEHRPQRLSLSNYPSSKLAAVLILLYEKEGVLRVLLTTRSRSLRSHPFQTALPGGKLDPDDVDFVGAAFREANEEVGLPLNSPHLHVLCNLRPFFSLYKLLVTPVVAVLTDLTVLENLTPSAEEVDLIFDHPLEAILEPSLAMNEPLSVKGGENWPYATDFYDMSDNQTIFGTYRMHRIRSCYTPIKGLTAEILIMTAEIAYTRKTSYERLASDQTEPTIAIARQMEEEVESQTKAQATDGSIELGIPGHEFGCQSLTQS